MRFKGPLADSYWSAVAMVLMALTPFLVLSSAIFPLQEAIGSGSAAADPREGLGADSGRRLVT